jgi:F-type H+-transporting ATPase subunit delta
LLATRGRLDLLADIADEYQRLLDSYHGIERGEVVTAISLDDEVKLKLAEHLSAVVGRKVVLKSEVDPGVIGGFVARVGGKLVDGSTRSQLEALKRELAGAER